MKIAVDARFYGSGHTGLGRYTTNVLKYLPGYLPDHSLQVLLRDAEYPHFPAGKNIEKVRAEILHYSLAEQVRLPVLLRSLGSDLLYTFHFNAPVFSNIPAVVTVHDLIKSHFTGPDTTTRSPWLYRLKRAGYSLAIKQNLERAGDVIVPTNTVKNDILAVFPAVKPERIHVIPEAPDAVFRQKPNSLPSDFELPGKYLLFVGNAYPHKNLSVLLQAFRRLKDSGLELVIVARRTPFLSRTLAPFDQSRIKVLSDLTDQELVAVYRRASLLVTPSLMEGYGLVGLEALMVGTPVVASSIPVYREVYGSKVTFFDPTSVPELVAAITKRLATKRPAPLKFSRTWEDVAENIAEVIHARCLSL